MRKTGTLPHNAMGALAFAVVVSMSFSAANAGKTTRNFNKHTPSAHHMKKKVQAPSAYRSHRQKKDRYGARKRFGPESERRWDGYRFSTPAMYW